MGFPVTRPHVEIRLVVKKRTEINNCGKPQVTPRRGQVL